MARKKNKRREWPAYKVEAIYNPRNKRSEWQDTSTYAGVRNLSREIRAARTLNTSILSVR
jgi:hypothetical protein